MRSRIVTLTLSLLASLLAGPRAGAQLVALHAVLVPGGDGRRPATGIEGEIGGTVAMRRLVLWPSIAIEYQRQHDLGPGRGRLAGQLRVLPRSSDGHLLPYLGVSGSANKSGGEQSEWSGIMGGLQGLGGLLYMPSDDLPVALLIEERFGYVKDQNHATATHVGLAISF